MPSFNMITVALASFAVSVSLALPNPLEAMLEKRSCGKTYLTGNYGPCYQYCNTHTSLVNGEPLHASAKIDCTTKDCTAIHANSVTVTESYTVSTGFSIEPITATTDFTWSKSVASSDLYEFNIAKGSVGYIAFTPKMHEICGVEHQIEATTGGPSNAPYCTTKVTKTDSNACGRTADKLSDGTANGEYSFCHENGSGCHPLTPNKK